ncbi:MAG: zinc-binding dehydrogenase [Pseudomonadota bacterium]
MTKSFEKLFALYSAGRLAPHIGMTVPLAEANEALDLLRRRGATGKVVIACDR